MLAEKMVKATCCECGVSIWMTATKNEWLRDDARRWFYCVDGHRQHYSSSENDLAKIRRERDRLKQQAARRDDEIREEKSLRRSAERSAAAQRGQVTKLKNRAQAGVCPCCSRTFQNLQRHMHSMHPDFAKKEDA